MSEDSVRPGSILLTRYRIERELGRGGMATVFVARDLRLERDVAVKVISPDLGAAVSAERFKREIEIASHLTHPHILPVHDSGHADGLLFYVMPFVAGESLAARLAREHQLPIPEAIRITCEVARALDFAHRQGFVHRDIKPANILLEDGHALIADFGIARAMTHSGGPLTQVGITVGTAAYMSPEQAAGDPTVDGRSDVYSLGCVLYEMLAGLPPFSASSSSALLARHAIEPPPPVHVVRNTVSEQIEDVLMQALAKAPADRFVTAGAFADALEATAFESVGSTRRTTAPMVRPQHRAAAGRPTGKAVRLAWLGVFPLLALGVWGSQRWQLDDVEAATASDIVAAKRIAVLYFEDLSAGRLAHLAEGLTEHVTNQLDQVRDLDVISSGGVLALRDGGASRDSVARSLGVGTLVEGSIEELEKGRLRVAVRLVDGASGVDLDRASFEGNSDDVLALRDTLALEIARFLRGRIGQEVYLRQSRAGASNPLAWMLVQRAEHARKEAGALRAEDEAAAAHARISEADSLYAEAEALDPDWPEPSIKRSSLAFDLARTEPEPLAAATLIDDGLAHAERALAADAGNADALEQRGALTYLLWLRHLARTPGEQDELLARAESDLRAAVAANPGQANAWNLLSHLSFQKPDLIEAKIAASRAYEEDAYLTAAPDILWRLYTASYELEQFPDALKWCREGRTRFPSNPRFVQCRLWLMTAKATSPDPSLAWSLVDSLMSLTPTESRAVQRRSAEMLAAAALANAGLADSARHVLDRAHPSFQEDPEGEVVSLEAFVRTLANDREGALRLIKEYLALKPEHREGLAQSQSWWWRDLRQDPRFQEVVGSSR